MLEQDFQRNLAVKADLPGAEENLQRLKDKLAQTDVQIFPISAATRKGFTELMRAVTKMIREMPAAEPFEEEETELAPEERTFEIVKLAEGYEVTGLAVTELVRGVNFEDEDSLNYFHRALRKIGIIDALRQAGASEGDTVIIEKMEFEFME